MDRESALNAPWTDPAALLGFVDELREAGYNIATEQYVTVQDLVLVLTAGGEGVESPERMRGILGPVLCSSPAEQQDFRNRFDDWATRFSSEDEDEEPVEEAGELEREIAALDQTSRWWRWGLAVLLLVVASGLLYTWPWVEEEPTQPAAEPMPTVPSEGPTPDRAEEDDAPDANKEVLEIDQELEESAAARGSLWRQIAPPVLMALLVPLAWILAWQGWWRYQARLFLERHAVSERPEVERVAVRSLLDEILPMLSLLRTARDFRRRRSVASSHLDVVATVDATARHGGWLTLIACRRQVLPEYLVLVDRTSFRDQQAELVENLVDRLASHDVLITRYHFDADPRICFPAGKGAPTGLRQLASKYPCHRLLVFSDAAELFDPATDEFEPWADELLRFDDRALLTPGPPSLLGRRFTVLSRQFVVLSATTDGLAAWIRSLHGASVLESSADGTVPLPTELAERPQRWLARDAPEAWQVESVLEELEVYLGRPGFYWLSACAIYPALHLNLTVHLGNVLRDGDGKKLLELKRFAALTRLPWFRHGSMPDWLRHSLISRLSRDEERNVREELEAVLLSALRAGPGDEFELDIARGSGHSVGRLARAVLWTLAKRQPEDGPLRDHVFPSFMSGRRPRPLAVRVPAALRGRLAPKPIVGKRRWVYGLRAWQSVLVLGGLTLALVMTPSSTLEPSSDLGVPPLPRIHQIQGSGHRSPLEGREVQGVVGLVTAVGADQHDPGFWIQDPDGNVDGYEATSEGLFVSLSFTSTGDEPRTRVQTGQKVEVAGRVEEWREGRSGDLPLTRLMARQVKILVAERRPLPPAVRLGRGGREIPRIVGNAIDFFEGLEGMRVEIDQAVVVGATSRFGELTVVADGGAGIRNRSGRGGIVLSEDDPHPERLLVSMLLLGTKPSIDVGARFDSPFTGVVDYDFSNYRILPDSLPEAVPPAPAQEVTALRSTNRQLTLATFNVFNLSARDPATKLSRLADTLVRDLGAPDIVALQEVQDENGSDDDGVVDGAPTFETLIAAIHAAGGPRYDFRQINPVDKTDGGQPGGNIRVGFLFNPQRVDFMDRGQAGALDETRVLASAGGVFLSHSPGRVSPLHPAFENNRKPLVGEFRFRDTALFVIATHLGSKRGDDPIMGARQPPKRGSEVQRIEQTRVLHALMERFLEFDPKARVVVLGDMNELEFRPPMVVLKGSRWTNLVERIPVADRYTFNFNGNSQALDHVLISPALAEDGAPEVDIVHVNADRAYERRGSDHDPVLVRLSWN